MFDVKYELLRGAERPTSFNKYGTPPEVRAYIVVNDAGLIATVKKEVPYGELGKLLNHIMDDLEIQLFHHFKAKPGAKEEGKL